MECKYFIYKKKSLKIDRKPYFYRTYKPKKHLTEKILF